MQQIIKISLLFILSISYIGCASSKPDPRIAAMIKKRQEAAVIRQKKQQEAELAKQEDTKQWKRFAPKYNNHYELVQAWKKAGFSAQEAIEWEKYVSTRDLHNSRTAWSVKKSIQQGATLPLVKKWKNELGNKIEYHEVADLINNNLTLAEVNKSQTAIKTKFAWRDLINFKKKGFSIEETIKFINARFNYFGAEDCKKLGVTKEEDAIKWGKVNGLHRCEEDVIAYKKIGFTPHEYRVWSRHGFHPKDALKWKIVGANNATYWYNYNQYAKNKYTPKEAKEWVDIGVFKPKEANIGMKSKKDFLNKSKILKRNHCKTIHIIHVEDSDLFGRSVNGGFHNVDEYDNKGKCYQFTGNLIQRLDRKHGLVKNGNFLYHATFNQSWRERTTKIGVLKGEGAYKYITAEGSRKIIPKGKVLFFDD